jgi:hypothetical protein
MRKNLYSEKFYSIHLLPLIPVYYGNPSVPNITSLPSFIKVSEFRNPKLLAEYLLYLDANDAEYQKYFQWRKHPELLNKQYLDIMQKRVPGPAEYLNHQIHKDGKLWMSVRRSVCCRLCDERYLRFAKATRHDYVRWTASDSDIMRLFYGKPVSFGDH